MQGEVDGDQPGGVCSPWDDRVMAYSCFMAMIEAAPKRKGRLPKGIVMSSITDDEAARPCRFDILCQVNA
jgi:hypothetical protein